LVRAAWRARSSSSAGRQAQIGGTGTGKALAIGVASAVIRARARRRSRHQHRSVADIAQTYGLTESAAYRNIKWCENTLAKSKAFRLPAHILLLHQSEGEKGRLIGGWGIKMANWLERARREIPKSAGDVLPIVPIEI
jgi:hypothetical protein